LERALGLGDTVTLRIVEAETPTAPTERARHDPSFVEAEERSYYERLRAKYEKPDDDKAR
jgi:hypothetical protein